MHVLLNVIEYSSSVGIERYLIECVHFLVYAAFQDGLLVLRHNVLQFIDLIPVLVLVPELIPAIRDTRQGAMLQLREAPVQNGTSDDWSGFGVALFGETKVMIAEYMGDSLSKVGCCAEKRSTALLNVL